MGDIEPFVSPIDGSVITGRAALREHNKRHDVTNIADYNKPGGYWDKKAAERAKFFQAGGYDRARRIEHLKNAFEHHRNRSRK